MPTYENGRGRVNIAGLAGDLTFREDEWGPFIRALAKGGHATGLRVLWRCPPEEPRYLWNGVPDNPCVVGTTEPVPWEFVPWELRTPS